jgi:hypothetical protein
MIILRSRDLLVRVDPSHGAEILDLIDLVSGRQVLARPAYPAAPARAGDLDDEETWCASYKGGWQIVTPNAGAACNVAGQRHGFHGAASISPWQVLEENQDQLTVCWRGHGLEITRSMSVAGPVLTAETEWKTLGDRVPVIAVEHVTVGNEILVPEVEISLPGGRVFEQSELESDPPVDACLWPNARMLDGTERRQDIWRIEETRAQVLSVVDLPDGWAEVRNRANGTGLRLDWEVSKLPYIWLWHEVRMSGGVWRHQTEILGVEPASVPHPLGLAAAVMAEQATWVEPQSRYQISIEARLLRSG